MTLAIGSLFSGIGGLDLGLERAGHSIRWQVEIDPRCRSVLARHWPAVSRYDDIREVRGDEIEAVDVLVGGFPCQDLSLAGRRAGLGGARSGLWWEFHRLVVELRPEWVVVENVPGLLSSAKGRDMGAVIGALVDLGYGYAWRVLDARYFGLAQRRRRLFLVCRAGADGASAAAVLLEPESCTGRPAPGAVAREEPSSSPGNGADGGGKRRALWRVHHPAAGQDRPRASRELIAATLTRSDNHPFSTLIPVGVQANSRGDTRLQEIVGSLATTRSTSQLNDVLTGAGVRRLLPVERERLQGLPDGWTRWGERGEEMPMTVREAMTGNAVAVPVAAWIGDRLWAAAGAHNLLAELVDRSAA